MRWSLSRVRRWSRVIHRDLSYFLIGACVLYALSGFVLSLRDSGVDVITVRTPISAQLAADLSGDSLVAAWNAQRGDLPEARSARAEQGEVRLVMPGARVYYNRRDGSVRGELVQPREWLHFANRIHFNRKGAWSWMGVFFSVAFGVLVVTGMLMTGGKKGFARRGVWFMLGGLALMVLLLYL